MSNNLVILNMIAFASIEALITVLIGRLIPKKEWLYYDRLHGTFTVWNNKVNGKFLSIKLKEVVRYGYNRFE